MISDAIPQLANLTPQEKWLLAGELWDEVAKDPNAIPSSEEQQNEIRERWEEYKTNPDKGVTWEEIKERLGKE